MTTGLGVVPCGWGWPLAVLQISPVDLLLSADNAVVIALACRGLRGEDVRRVAALGIAGAVVLRLAMASCATVRTRRGRPG